MTNSIAEIRASSPGESPIREFETFIRSSKPFVVAAIKNDLDLIARRAAAIADWLVPHDLLAVAGIAGDEDAYTDLLAWALSPDADPDTALKRQRAWLQHLGLEFCRDISKPATPQPQFHTKDGRLDMILDFSGHGHVVAIEAKTRTEEHATPSGKAQTIAYPVALRQALKIPQVVEIHMIFLTPDRRRAVNEDAICCSFVEFVVALASQFPPDAFASKNLCGFRLVFTHLLKCTAPNELEVDRLLRQIVEWSASSDWKTDDAISLRLNTLFAAKRLLLSEIGHA